MSTLDIQLIFCSNICSIIEVYYLDYYNNIYIIPYR